MVDNRKVRPGMPALMLGLLVSTGVVAQSSAFNPTIAGIPVYCTSYQGQPVAFIANRGLNDVGRARPGLPPTIELNPDVLVGLTAKMQMFWYGHECAHHVLPPQANTESNADCWSIQQMKRQGLLSEGEVPELMAQIAKTPGSMWGHLPGPSRAQLFAQCFRSAPSAVADAGQRDDERAKKARQEQAPEEAPFTYFVKQARNDFDDIRGNSRGDGFYESKVAFPGATSTSIVRDGTRFYVSAQFKRNGEGDAWKAYEDLVRMAKRELGPSWTSEERTSDIKAIKKSTSFEKTTERAFVAVGLNLGSSQYSFATIRFLAR